MIRSKMNHSNHINLTSPNRRLSQNPSLLASYLLLTPALAHAVDVAPNVGNFLQQNQPVMPQPPSPGQTGLEIEDNRSQTVPQTAPFEVKTISISGNEKIDTATLHALVADTEGKSITLSQLLEVANRISNYYHSQGYMLARAYIPQQDIKQGQVLIAVLEAKYGQIKLDNHSEVNDALLEDSLSELHTGEDIEQTRLDRSLLLLSDIPGIANTATLQPGASPGSSDLQVNSETARSMSGNLQVDNYGNRYTGRPRVGGNVNFYNPLQHGDVLSISGISAGGGMDYGNLSYESLINGRGTRVGGAYTAMTYQLNGSLSELNAQGNAQVGNLWAKQTLIRSRDFNLYGRIDYDHVDLRDKVSVSGVNTFRHLDFGVLSLAGDHYDTLLGGGVNTWNLAWTGGNLSFDNFAAQAANAATANTQGLFSKWNANLTRLQSVTEKDGFYLAFTGQWAMDNLDSSRKMIVGGPYTVRAYDMGAITADSGYIGTAEFRHDLGELGIGRWQAIAFIDSAYVTINAHNWSGAGANNATLSGAGTGLNWQGPKMDWLISSRLHARIYVAAPFGPTPAILGNTDSVRGWAEIGMGF